jgi:hypothetical protein
MPSFDWENAGPSPEALAAFADVKDEREFPHSYSGQSWLAAYRMWKVVKDAPEKLNVGPYENVPGVELDDLGLSGFMYGSAVNAVRQMLGKAPGRNPAILTLGEKEEPPYPSVGPAEKAMRSAIGGDKE